MINLIKIELKKIFHKKAIYIIYMLLLIFILLNNILYKFDYDEEGYYIDDYKKDTKEISNIEDHLQEYNDYNIDYITLKTELTLLKIKNKFPSKSWQYSKINYLYDDIYNINYYTYIEKNDEKLEYYNKSYNEKINKFNTNDWKYFVENEIDILNNEIEKTSDIDTINKYKEEIEILNLRLDNNIEYGINYLNDALEIYIDSKEKLTTYTNLSKLDYLEKKLYNETVSNFNISKYIIDNKINLNKENNLNALLRTIVEDYQLFIIIVILLISGTIVSEEFIKGTIKLLLIKPYKRSTILLSKYLTSIIVLLLTIIFTILLELIIGGYLFGYSTLTMKVAIYNFSTSTVDTYNVFIYMFIRIIYNLPLLIMLLTICFGLSVIFTNNIVPIILTLLLYTLKDTINTIIIKSNIKFIKYLLTINMDFKDYLFGNINKTYNINIKSSFIIYIIYLLIFIIITFIIFKKKNIKNVE